MVCLTATHESEPAGRTLRAVAADDTLNPFDFAELLERVQTAVGRPPTRDRSQRLVGAQNERVSVVAHDLKNPLGSIRFAAMMLRDQGIHSPDPRGELIESIIESCDWALEFISAYLEECAQTAAIDELSLTDVDLLGQVQAERKQNVPAATRKGIDLTMEYSLDGAGRVCADARALRCVLSNLISNAIKFSPPGSLVQLIVAEDRIRSQAHVEVIDHGPGLTEEDRRFLFTAYRPLSARPTAGESSTGLGLSIAYDLVTRMGGDIECDSRPGEGACFRITLPLA